MEQWLQSAPELGELVAGISDRRKDRKGKIAVVIPSFNNNLLLKKQLEMLSKQTFSDFDIIAVYGKDDDLIDTPEWASMLHIKEKSRTGSAGAFYIGEKKALEDGYELITLADNDCVPVSEDLFEKFSDAADKGADVMLPHIIYVPSEKSQNGYVIHHYGCLKNEVFRKAGLSFLPFYFGGEDFELFERIRDSGFKVHNIDSLVSHPKNKPALISSEKRKYYCGRGELEALLINGKYLRAFTYTILYLEMGLAFLLMGKKSLADEIFRSVRNATSMEFFKSRNEPLDETIEATVPEKFDIALSEENIHEDKHWLNVNAGAAKRMSYLLSELLHSNHYFGKRVLVSERHDPADIIAMLMAKTAYIKFEGKYYLVHKNRGTLSIIGALFLLGLSLPFIMAGSFLLTLHGALNKKIRNISSQRYGL
jgi:GT2 family glycosyltransferase